jgi:hypothetical protein
MAEDRSLKDIIRFLDPSGEISDAEIASISNSLKFSEVLDLISAVSDDKVDAGRELLSKHDPRFSVTHGPETQPEESMTNEYVNVPGAHPSGFKPIAPQGTVGSLPSTANKATNPNGQMGGGDEEDLNALVNDPSKKNDPNVKQIQSLLQRLQNR